jgi:hypothetical protein
MLFKYIFSEIDASVAFIKPIVAEASWAQSVPDY